MFPSTARPPSALPTFRRAVAARWAIVFLWLGSGLFVGCFTGCAGYQLGSQTLYRPDIQTVAVPVFHSESLRRLLGERITEAVIKEIELKTPYKVTQGGDADSILTGRIVQDSKYAITENANDEPRDIELEMFVEIQWLDRGGRELLHQQIGLPNSLTSIGQATHFVPEGGQSLVTAQQETLERLAEQIVARMEVPW